MVFLNNNKFLAACGIRENSPILLYNVRDETLLLSTKVSELIIDLFSINNYVGFFQSALDSTN